MGLGLFGGGAAAARFLAEKGAKVTVTDLKSAESLAPSIEKLKDLDIAFHLGGHVESDFSEADMILVSPAIPKNSKYLQIAFDRGVPLETEMNLFFKLCRGVIVGITGSNGKTTTTALLHDMIKRRFQDALLGGNLGKSLLSEAEKIKPCQIVVLELSSFQLEDLGQIKRGPEHGILTNITPNHLDRHGTMEQYADAKKNVFRFQSENGITVLNADNEISAKCSDETPGRVLYFSRKTRLDEGAYLDGDKLVIAGKGEICRRGKVILPGDFNIENILAAAATADALGVGIKEIRQSAITFKGVAHRLEFLGIFSGVRCYNDSIATNPESTIGAIRAIKGRKVLMLGGSDKNLDFSGLAAAIKEAGTEAAAVTMGATGPKIAAALRSVGLEPAAEVKTLAEAVEAAFEIARDGDAILLSPASASFDQFENFEHRGNAFRYLVKKYEKGL
jgi:UDP-N-acetylmuramoylalanine--D-glutamate ligase